MQNKNIKCSVAGCNNPVYCKATCKMHDARYRKRNSYELPAPQTILEMLLWHRKIDDRGCWLWTGSCGKNGYGQIYIKRAPDAVHRISFCEFIGKIPDGMMVLHKCDVKTCFNPDHLYLGTHADNMRDMRARDRVKCGDIHPFAKLRSSDVVKILSEYKGETQRSIAKRFGCSQSNISMILSGVTWKRVKNQLPATNP